MTLWLFLALLSKIVYGTELKLDFVPCVEISRELRFPCKCALGPIEAILDGDPSVSINCDRTVFLGDFPPIPHGAPIVSFTQRWVGHQSLPTQLFTSSGLPIRSLDFSGNSLRRLTERLLQRLQSTLTELRLADNLFGDTLNPIFSSNEFHGLANLQILDLSGNDIRAIEEGILEGCENLRHLHLDRNSLTEIPTSSLNGPKKLKILTLRQNRISSMKTGAFLSQGSLEKIDLSYNSISSIEGGSLQNLSNLKSLHLGHNRLTRFNSDVFQGADNLEDLDLAENFIMEFPTTALKSFPDLKFLNLSSNLIQTLNNDDLISLTNLHNLDLGRNNIANIVPGTFLGLRQLKRLDISVNSLRTIEDDAFEGLDNLEMLLLKDNNILLIPASAVGRLPKLTTLELDYNRVAAVSADILRSIADQVSTLIISRNVVRELPSATFQNFAQLQHLDLQRNLITTLNSDAFSGLEKSLISLDVSKNRISTLSETPLSLTHLEILDLSNNALTELSRNAFTLMPNLKQLNVSYNEHLSSIPTTLLRKLFKLEILDLSTTNMKSLSPDLLSRLSNLKEVYLQNNVITEILGNTFINLPNLTIIDLSHNSINSVRPGAFVNVMHLQKLLLNGNQLNSFKGEFFNTGTSLEILDISNNQLSYLFPSSFKIHPRLRKLYAARNKFNFFPSELIATLQFLEFVDLSGNALKTVEELDFARLPRLRTLILAQNELDSVSEMAFHNSTQLQVIDLSYNKLDRLGERMFEGLIRLECLNVEGNLLADLPETLFDRSRLQMLENINLKNNSFETAPLSALQRQYFFLFSVDLSHNKLRDIPADDSIMVNIKKIDLSFNPLSVEAVTNVLGEPKTVRDLNLAGTGISSVTQLETPFLRYLNLSFNNISMLQENIFERATLLEHLDLSHNNLSETTTTFPKLWAVLKSIQSLNLSGNAITTISGEDFKGLTSLRVLSLNNLKECTRIEKNTFTLTPNLEVLDVYNFPKLGYIDIKGLLKNLPFLERVNIETKDPAVGSDQLQPILHPRLRELGIHGSRLHSISSGTLSGLKRENVVFRLCNTSISGLPPTLFFPVPRSSHVTLDVTGSQLTTLSPQLLVALDDRRGDLILVGLETNPIVCDCSARALRRWLPHHMTAIRCLAPDHLIGRLLVEIGDDELTCNPRKSSSTTTVAPNSSSRTTKLIPKTTEPEIIWSIASTEKAKPKPVGKGPNSGSSAVNNDDTLIIGIVGGVVAFIAILIIIICIIRLRMSQSGPTLGGSSAVGPPVLGPGSSCACSVKGGQPLYSVGPYAPSYTATLPHKVNMSGPPSIRPAYSTMGRAPYNVQPYYVTYPSDDKIYR